MIGKLSEEVGYVATEAALLHDIIYDGDKQQFQSAEEALSLDDLIFWVSIIQPETGEQTWKPAVGKKVKILERDFGAHFVPEYGWRITELETGCVLSSGETLNEAMLMCELMIERAGGEKLQRMINKQLEKMAPKPTEVPKLIYTLEELA